MRWEKGYKLIKGILLLTLTTVILTFTACNGSGNPSPDLDGTSWVLTQIQGKPVLNGTHPTLNFKDGQASGNSSCNSFNGKYSLHGDRISFGSFMSTLMACIAPEVMEQEATYITALGNVSRFIATDGRLDLLDKSGKLLLTFVAQDVSLDGRP